MPLWRWCLGALLVAQRSVPGLNDAGRKWYYRHQAGILETGAYLPDELWNVASYCFHQPADADQSGAAPLGIFYSLRNKNLRPTKIFYHKLGDACEGSLSDLGNSVGRHAVTGQE